MIFSLYYFKEEPTFKNIFDIKILENEDVVLSFAGFETENFIAVLGKEKDLFLLLVLYENMKIFEENLLTPFIRKYDEILIRNAY